MRKNNYNRSLVGWRRVCNVENDGTGEGDDRVNTEERNRENNFTQVVFADYV